MNLSKKKIWKSKIDKIEDFEPQRRLWFTVYNRKVWYHQIWISNNLGFMVLILMYIYLWYVHVIVCIRNQSLYIRTVVNSVIIYNDQLKPVIINNDQLKPVIIYNDQQFSLPFHKQTSFLYNSNNCLKRQNQTLL